MSLTLIVYFCVCSINIVLTQYTGQLLHLLNNTVCYEPVGCFSMLPPWLSVFRLIPPPQPPQVVETTFLYYSRKYNGVHIKYPFIKLQLKPTTLQKRVIIIIHGYKGKRSNGGWMLTMKDIIMSKDDAIVFICLWNSGRGAANYLQAVANTRVVAREIKLLMIHLFKMGFSPSQLHIIGHSLGAQVAGYVGKEVPGLGLITALDPARHGFTYKDEEVKLVHTDALRVLVIHTEFCIFSQLRPSGDVDFYLNYGWNQPGCETEVLSSVCSHNKAIEYYENILSSRKCVFQTIIIRPASLVFCEINLDGSTCEGAMWVLTRDNQTLCDLELNHVHWSQMNRQDTRVMYK